MIIVIPKVLYGASVVILTVVMVLVLAWTLLVWLSKFSSKYASIQAKKRDQEIDKGW